MAVSMRVNSNHHHDPMAVSTNKLFDFIIMTPGYTSGTMRIKVINELTNEICIDSTLLLYNILSNELPHIKIQPCSLEGEHKITISFNFNGEESLNIRLRQEDIVEDYVVRPLDVLTITSVGENGVNYCERGSTIKTTELHECNICFAEIEIGTECPEIACNHMFHIDCLKLWRRNNETCPYCRQKLQLSNIQLCIGEFLFSHNYTYESCIEDLNRNCYSEMKVETIVNNDQELLAILAKMCWDEQIIQATYRLPIQFLNIFKNYRDYNEAQIIQDLLLRSGIESNPGPVQSRPLQIRNNDPRIVKLEKAIERRDSKLRTLLRALERASKRPSAQGMWGDLKQVINKAANIPENADFGDLSGNITKIANFVEEMLPNLTVQFENTATQITDKIVNIKDDMIKLTLLLILVKLFTSFKCYRTAIVVVLLFICQHYGLHQEIIDLVKQLMRQISPHAQSGSKNDYEELIYSPIFQTCGKIIFAALAFICVKQIPGKQDWDTYITRLDRLPKAHAGAQKIIDFTTEYWNLALESLKIMVLGKTREELRAVAGIYDEVEKWAEDVKKYLDLAERNKIDLDIDSANEVEKLWRRGLEYKTHPLLLQDRNSRANKLISTMLMPASKLYEYVSSSPIKGGGPRMRPVCVWLCGASGIGKTEMVYPLCIDVLREMGHLKPQDFHHQVYPRQVETEFWDGYKGQKIIIYDDAFQKKDDKVNGNPELFEVIRSCNTFPQHLHMAALHDKNTFSAAELMLFTTNEMEVEINSLTFPDAFKNRMYENAYEVSLKEQYREYEETTGVDRKYKLDLTKVNPETPIDLDIYQFQKVNKNRESVGDPIDYSTFSKLIAKQWRDQKQGALRRLEHLNKYAVRPISQMLSASQNSDAESIYEDAFDFADDIAKQIKKGRTLIEIEYDYASSDSMYASYQEFLRNRQQPSIWRKYLDRVNVSLDEFKSKMNEWRQEIKKILSEHPYMALLSIIGVCLSAFGLYTMLSEKKNSPTAEISHSGDAKTIKQVRPVVEISSSGDVRTSKTIRPVIESKISSELSASGDVKTTKSNVIRIESSMNDEDVAYLSDVLNGRQPTAQGCSDLAALNLVTDILFKNNYKMMCEYNDKTCFIGNVTFVKGWVVSMPYHYLEGLALRNMFDGKIILTQDGYTKLIQFHVSHLITKDGDGFRLTENVERLKHQRGDDMDGVLVNLFRTQCQPHRSILKHIVTQDDLKMLTGCMQGTMSTFHVYDGQLMRMCHTFQEVKALDGKIEIELDLTSGKTYTQRSYYTYKVPTREGDCGSLLGIFSKRMTRKLIGMHIAGDATGTGYACPWTLERIQNALIILEKRCGPCAQMTYSVEEVINTHVEPNMPEGGFVPVGKANFRVGQASKTALLRSRIYGMLKPAIMAPAILKPTIINGVLVDPLMNGLKKCGVIPTLLKSEDIEACANDVGRILRNNYANLDLNLYKRVLTYEEAVAGANDEFMVAVNRTTSPGVPYSFETKGKPGKTRWLGQGEFFDFESEDAKRLRTDVENLIERCRRGEISGVYCTDTLKDEKRDLAKVQQGKTRVFSACPVHFVLAFRQYFLGFSAWCMHNRIDNEIAVGTNVYSLDWQKIALKIKQKGTRVIAGDFSNFDGSLNAQILWSIFDIIDEWYNDGEENRKIRLTLWAHIVHSTHIFENNVYMWTHSQPSGNPFTVIINSIYNSIIMRMAWRIVMKPHNNENMEKFNKYVSMISYGDDNILNISTENNILSLFNQQTIADALATIGHTYTDEGKTGEVVESRTIDEINFLKRGFRMNESGLYVAPLEEKVIYEMLNWTRNTVDPDEILSMNVRTAAREMALHGKSKFSKFINELKQIETNFKIIPQTLTYCEYLRDMETNAENYFE